jgi:UDP-N-acetylglucosamine acyltransferase
VTKDVLPFCIADGHPSVMRGINKVGLERNGFEAGRIRSIRSAYRTLLRQNHPLRDAIALLKSAEQAHPDISEIIAFAETSVLGLARSRSTAEEAER